MIIQERIRFGMSKFQNDLHLSLLVKNDRKSFEVIWAYLTKVIRCAGEKGKPKNLESNQKGKRKRKTRKNTRQTYRMRSIYK